MNILIVSSFLPYPLYSGGHIRLYNLIKQIAKNHTITLICEKRHSQGQEEVRELEKLCKKVITIDRKKQWSVQTILSTGFSNQPFLLTGHTLPQMKQDITDALASEPFDIIHIETFYVAQNVPKTNVPIVLVEHNIEYLVYKRFVDTAPLPLRPLLLLDIAKLKRMEEKMWRHATRIVAVSEEEKKLIPLSNVDVVPNGVDIKKFQMKSVSKSIQRKHKEVLFIGDFKWMQNKDALSFILSKIWPHIRLLAKEKNLSVSLHVVGRHVPQDMKVVASDIVFDENNTQSTEEIFSNADVLLAPIRVGGGTSYKILESLAVGTPVVTTPLGKEGISDTKDCIQVGESPQELAEKTIALLTDQKLYTILSHNGRALIEKEYSWDNIAKLLESSYTKALT